MLLATNLRRDKILLPLCVATFAAVAASSAVATADVYPDLASQVQGADLINSTPALVAMYGPIYDPTSLGAVSVFKIIGLGTALVGLFAALVVIRHTRADEELGRYELLAGGSIGRFASLAAALSIAGIGVVGIGLFTAVGPRRRWPAGRRLAGFRVDLDGRRVGVRRGRRGRSSAHRECPGRPWVGGRRAGNRVPPAGGWRCQRQDRAELAELAVADRMGAAGPPVRGGPLAARPTATGVRRHAGWAGYLPNPAPRHRLRPAAPAARPGPRGHAPLHSAGTGLAATTGSVPWLAGGIRACSASWSHRSSPASATCSARQWPVS